MTCVIGAVGASHDSLSIWADCIASIASVSQHFVYKLLKAQVHATACLSVSEFSINCIMPSRSLLLAGLLPFVALLCLQFSGVTIPDLLSNKYAVSISRSKAPIVMASTPAFRSVIDGLVRMYNNLTATRQSYGEDHDDS
jgi:hypothetical protein